jgi:hypothetical protein
VATEHEGCILVLAKNLSRSSFYDDAPSYRGELNTLQPSCPKRVPLYFQDEFGYGSVLPLRRESRARTAISRGMLRARVCRVRRRGIIPVPILLGDLLRRVPSSFKVVAEVPPVPEGCVQRLCRFGSHVRSVHRGACFAVRALRGTPPRPPRHPIRRP